MPRSRLSSVGAATRTRTPLRRRSRAALGVLVALATTAGMVAATSASATEGRSSAGRGTQATAAAAAPVSPLRLRAPRRAVLYRYDGWLDGSLGLRLQAQGAPFELWSNRPSYDVPIRTEWRSATGPVVLPEGQMPDFSGLPSFLRLIVRDSDGRVVRQRRLGVCLNAWETQRVEPAAPARSPYPFDCPWNPYTLGSVQGIQEGWASSLFPWGLPFALRNGRYTVTARITAEYARMFGIATADSERVFRLRIVEGEQFQGRREPRGRPAPRPAASEPTQDQAGAVVGPVPDLRSLPAFGIGLSPNGRFLRFAATTWNAGTSPLVVDGFRDDTGEDTMDAYQYFYDADGEQTGYQRVGTMQWHAASSHDHWHFLDFARYTLLNADRTEVVRSRKQSWCLANTDAVDYTVPGADWQPENTDLDSSCGGIEALSVRQVLSRGSGDTYAQYTAGQALRVDDLPNGTYYLQVTANPRGRLVEADTTNNVSLRKLYLRGRPGNRRVVVPQVGIIDDGFGFFRLHPSQVS